MRMGDAIYVISLDTLFFLYKNVFLVCLKNRKIII